MQFIHWRYCWFFVLCSVTVCSIWSCTSTISKTKYYWRCESSLMCTWFHFLNGKVLGQWIITEHQTRSQHFIFYFTGPLLTHHCSVTCGKKPETQEALGPLLDALIRGPKTRKRWQQFHRCPAGGDEVLWQLNPPSCTEKNYWSEILNKIRWLLVVQL